MTGGLSNALCQKVGIQYLRTCRVPHSNITYALTVGIGEKDSFKLTFSADTTPCDDFIRMGHDSTLLIHEATYPDEFHQNAKLNRHCTISQAIKQSQHMKAKYTILTHFSKRHELPFVDSDKYKNIGIAFDFMELTKLDLPKLSSLNEKYQRLLNMK